MTIRSGLARKVASRKARKPDDLLGIWLDIFNEHDNSTRRRAAKLRRIQRQRRPISMRPEPRTDDAGGRARARSSRTA